MIINLIHLTSSCYAGSDTTSLDYQDITQHLRCLKCQNQTLSDSNSPFANVLKQEILDELQQGVHKQAIYQKLVTRYGDYILYEPPINVKTYFLWGSPVLMLIIAIYMCLRKIKWH